MIPFLDRLESAKRVLIVGCGGGFDVYAGVPLALQLMAVGKEVIFANSSFTNLALCGGERLGPILWRVDGQSGELPYFPEKWLAEWLVARGRPARIYACAKSGVRPLRAAFETIMKRHRIDLVILVDGGTDSILFGDEPGLGSVAEDAVSTVAACAAAGENVLLAAIGSASITIMAFRITPAWKTWRGSSATAAFWARSRSCRARPRRMHFSIWSSMPTDASRSTRASSAIRSPAHCVASSATITPPTAPAAASCSSTR
jgi:hypothetical protein